MRNRLKQFRVDLRLTQTEVASKVGVTQPNYQRWESGAAPIPHDKLKKLAKALKTTSDALLGRYAPVRAVIYPDPEAGDSKEHSYWGEIAVHFCSGGSALVLSISDAEFERLHGSLQETETGFMVVRSIANQTVAIRMSAVSDFYLSSEAYDTFGPEHPSSAEYHNANVHIPDTRDWEIIEAIGSEIGLEDYDPATVERITKMIMITDEQYKKLVADGHIKPENLEREQTKNRAYTDRIFTLATCAMYQLSAGRERQRVIDCPHEAELFRAFEDAFVFGARDESSRIYMDHEGGHRIIFINKSAIDYMSVPTHMLEAGRVETEAEEIDSR